MATDIEAHGYTYTYSGYTFHVFHNHQLDQELLAQLQQYIPEWYPNSTPNHITVYVDSGQGQTGIYSIESVMNLFTICAKFMHDTSHLQVHINGILEYIYALIKHWVTVQLANEIHFKIAFYKPSEISEVTYGNWPGSWRFTKNTNQTICGSYLPSALSEYTVRWSFDDNYQIKTGAQTQWNFTPSNNQYNRNWSGIRN
jgi:hypothetical protein